MSELEAAMLNLMLELELQDEQNAARLNGQTSSRDIDRTQETLDNELAMELQRQELDEFEQRRGGGGGGVGGAATPLSPPAHAAPQETIGGGRDYDYNLGSIDDGDDDLLAALAASRISANNHVPQPSAGSAASSSSAADLASTPTPRAAPECASCMEAIRPPSSAIHLPCAHHYCPPCMTAILTVALSDEARFPARCCAQPLLPVAEDPACSALLGASIVARYRAKAHEHAARDRTYCHATQPPCGQFIPAESVEGNRATCIWCERVTCTRCKAMWHGEGVACVMDEAAEETLRLAEDNGWKRCFSCRTVVELFTGCNHITCHCGAQFCYACGKEWKTCSCVILRISQV